VESKECFVVSCQWLVVSCGGIPLICGVCKMQIPRVRLREPREWRGDPVLSILLVRYTHNLRWQSWERSNREICETREKGRVRTLDRHAAESGSRRRAERMLFTHISPRCCRWLTKTLQEQRINRATQTPRVRLREPFKRRGDPVFGSRAKALVVCEGERGC